MAGKAGIKAGLIGLAALLVMTVINQFLPAGGLVYVSCGISLMLYTAIGVLAGFLLAPPRTPGKGASAGALAGLIGGGINGVVSTIIMIVRLAQGMGLAGMDPQQMEQLAELGMDPRIMAIPGLICTLALGSGLAAIGGAIFAAIKSD